MVFKTLVTLSLVLFPLAGTALAEEGVTDTSILFGSSLPLTGELGKRGLEYQAGVELALRKINAENGIGGRKLEIRVLDDGYSPQKAAENVRTFIEKEKVFGFFQILGTPSVKAIEPLLVQNKIPFVAPLTGGMSFRVPPNPLIFAIRPGFAREAKFMIDFLIKKGSKKFGFFFQDDSLGAEGKTAVTQALSAHGLKRAADASYKRGTLNPDAAIEIFKKAEVDTVILWATEKPTSNFIQKAVQAGLKFRFAGSAVSTGPDTVKDLADVNAEIYMTQPNSFFAPNPPAILKTFKDEAKAAKVNATQNNYESYVNTIFLAEALKRAGAKPTRADLVKAIESMKKMNIGGLDFNFSHTSHEGLSAIFMTKIEDGAIRPVQ